MDDITGELSAKLRQDNGMVKTMIRVSWQKNIQHPEESRNNKITELVGHCCDEKLHLTFIWRAYRQRIDIKSENVKTN